MMHGTENRMPIQGIRFFMCVEDRLQHDAFWRERADQDGRNGLDGSGAKGLNCSGTSRTGSCPPAGGHRPSSHAPPDAGRHTHRAHHRPPDCRAEYVSRFGEPVCTGTLAHSAARARQSQRLPAGGADLHRSRMLGVAMKQHCQFGNASH